jgi:hypothetical protein
LPGATVQCTAVAAGLFGVVDEDEEQELPFDYDNYYREATKLVENLIFEVDIPTIAAGLD